MDSGSKAIIAYVPAPHRGYLEFFRSHKDRHSRLYLLGEDLIAEHQSLVRHLPAASPDDVRKMLAGVGVSCHAILVLTKAMIPYVRRDAEFIVMPDEDIMHRIADTYFEWGNIEFDATVRLRWDWGATLAKRQPEGTISTNERDRYLMAVAAMQAAGSPDWWRQVGAVFVKNDAVMIGACNQHVPHEQSAYLEGDPRSSFEPGQHLELSLALHAEAAVIAEAARRGVAMEGGDLYVTTFPCPQCAYKIAATGIKRLFYLTGYTLLAGADALTARGIEIIRVERDES